MASAAPNNLPLLYRDLVPLNREEHEGARYRQLSDARFAAGEHAIPLTVDEFITAGRFYPIIFSAGENAVPLALMGLNEGLNTFIDREGMMAADAYVPAYLRRYPFLLARLKPEGDELSLCIDPTAGALGAEGEPVFENGEASPTVRAVLQFCEEFEQAGQRTGAFMAELKANDLLMEGEVQITSVEGEEPVIYRGFQMVNEEKLRNLRGDVLRKMMQSGFLPLVHAHLFSLQIMREIYARQVAQGFDAKAQTPGG